jgi:hypothetical protein
MALALMLLVLGDWLQHDLYEDCLIGNDHKTSRKMGSPAPMPLKEH